MSLLQIVDASNNILWDADDSTGLNNPYGLKTCAWAIDKGRTPTGLDLARPVSGTGAIKVQDRADAKVMSWVQGYLGVISNNPEDIRRAFGVLSQLLSVSTDESGYRIRYRPGDSMEIRYVEYLGTEFLPNLERGQPGEVRKLYDQLMDPDGQVVEVWRQPFDLGELLDSDVNKAQNSLFLAIGTSQAPLLWTWDSTTNVTNGAPDALTERFKVTLATTGTRNLQFTTAAASAAAGQQWLAKLWKIRASAAGVVRARVMIEFLSSTSVVLDSALGSLTSVGTTEMELPFATTLTAPTNTDRVRVSVQFQNSASTSVDVYMTEIQLEKGQASTNPTFARTSIAFTQNGLQVASGVPRYEAGKFSGGSAWIEEGTTNLLTSAMSTDFSAGWTLDGVTVGNNVTTAPDGTSNADRLIETAANSNHRAYSAALLTLGAAGTNSFYLKAAERNFAYVAVGGSQVAVFDLSLGTITSSAPDITASIVSVGSGWYRCSVATSNVVAGGEVQVGVLNASVAYNASKAYAGDITKGIYVWHAQGELKAYPTSWQIGGTARNAETLTVPTAGVWNKGNWSLEFWYNPSVTAPGSSLYLFRIFIDGNNSYDIIRQSNGTISAPVISGGVSYQTSSSSVLTAGTSYHIALVGNGSTFSLFVNGVQVGSAVAYTEPAGALPINMYLGSAQNGALQPNGLYDDLRISNRARTATEIAAVAASASPAPEDSATTYKLEFDSDLGVDLTDAPSMYRTGTETVSNNPASTTAMGRAMPMKVQGDAPAVGEYFFTPSSTGVLEVPLWLFHNSIERVSYLNSEKFFQCETNLAGVSTSFADAAASNGLAAKAIPLTTGQNFLVQAQINAAQINSLKGHKVDVYVRMLTSGAATFTVQLYWAFGTVTIGFTDTSETAVTPSTAGNFEDVYLGTIQIPDVIADTPMTIGITGIVSTTAGSPFFEFDFAEFRPIDEGHYVMEVGSLFSNIGAGESYYINEKGKAYVLNATGTGLTRQYGLTARGDSPLELQPGIEIVGMVAGTSESTGSAWGDSITITQAARIKHRPRWRI